MRSDSSVCCLAALGDGTLACGSSNGSITIWNTFTQTIVKTLSSHTKCINCLKELSDGTTLASGSGDTTIKIWKPLSGKLVRTLSSHTVSVRTLEQLSTGLLASGSNDKTIKLWNVPSGELVKSVEMEQVINEMLLLKDGNLACMLGSLFSRKLNLIILNPQKSCQIVRTIENETFVSLGLLEAGRLAIGQFDSYITVWDHTNWTLLKTLSRSNRKAVWSLKLLADGNLASGSSDGVIEIWNPKSGKLLTTIKVDEDADEDDVSVIVQLSDGRLASALFDSNVIKIWK